MLHFIPMYFHLEKPMGQVAEMILKKISRNSFNHEGRVRPSRASRLWVIVSIAALALPVISCGGGGGGGGTQTPQNPVPGLATLSPASAPAGSRSITLTVIGNSFVSGSVVRWNGSDRSTTYGSASRLTAAIPASDLAGVGTASITVFNPSPGGGVTPTSMTFTIQTVDPLSVLTTRLPDANNSKPYNYTLQASGGITPYTWSVTQGSLPSGLEISSSGGTISGTPPVVSSNTPVSFSVQISDFANVPNTVTQNFNIMVRANKLSRNDTCSTATPVSNGVIHASISPYGDMDVYSFQGTAGAQVTAEIYASRLDLFGDSTRDDFLDSFLEILNSSCAQVRYNDDLMSGVQDSRILNFTLTNTGTYYIRVSDLRGDGRPDFIYELHLSGIQ